MVGPYYKGVSIRAGADDIRRVIARARHHMPKTKLRSRKNCTPRTMYRYKGNTFSHSLLIQHVQLFKECDFTHTTILQTISTAYVTIPKVTSKMLNQDFTIFSIFFAILNHFFLNCAIIKGTGPD